MGKKIDDQWAFEVFAGQHPHEAHESDPDRFWAFFHGNCPMVPRPEMVKMLAAERLKGKTNG